MNGTTIFQSLSATKTLNAQGKNSAAGLSVTEGTGFANLFQSIISEDLSQISGEQGASLLALLQQLQLMLAQGTFPLDLNNDHQQSLQQNSEQPMSDLLSALSLLFQGNSGELELNPEMENLLAMWPNIGQLAEEDLQQLTDLPVFISVAQLEQVLDRLLATSDGKGTHNLPTYVEFFSGKNLFMNQDKNPEFSTEDLRELIQLLTVSEKSTSAGGEHVSITAAMDTQHPTHGEAKLSAAEQAIIKLMSLIARSEQGQNMLTDSSLEKAKLVFSRLLALQDQYSADSNADEGRGGSKLPQEAQMFTLPSMPRGLSIIGFNPLMQGTAATNSNSADSNSSYVNAGRFAEEMESVLLQKIKGMNGNDTSRATIRLHPEQLGQLDIKILLQNGRVTAQFSAETSMGKELIEKNMNILRTALVQHGLNIDKIEVNQNPSSSQSLWNNERGEQMLHQHQQHQRNQQQYQQPSPTKSGYSSFDEEELEFAELLESRRRVEVSGIDYTV